MAYQCSAAYSPRATSWPPSELANVRPLPSGLSPWPPSELRLLPSMGISGSVLAALGSIPGVLARDLFTWGRGAACSWAGTIGFEDDWEGKWSSGTVSSTEAEKILVRRLRALTCSSRPALVWRRNVRSAIVRSCAICRTSSATFTLGSSTCRG